MYRLFLPLLVTLLGVIACTSGPRRPPPPAVDGLAEAARPLLAQGDYLGASQLYLSAAKTAPENQRTDMRLQAAKLLAVSRPTLHDLIAKHKINTT